MFSTLQASVFMGKEYSDILLGKSEMPPENVLERFVQELSARFRTTSNSICNVQPKIELRSKKLRKMVRQHNDQTIKARNAKPKRKELRRDCWSRVTEEKSALR